MSDCKSKYVFPHFRVAQSIFERDSIPTLERVIGMVVVVVSPDYKLYQLQGNDAAYNNWKDITIDIELISNTIGHVTESNPPDSEKISNEYLNTRYPLSQEGFRVTIESLKTTFMKISGGRWVIFGTFINL